MTTELLTDKVTSLRRVIAGMDSVIVAFSGGIDSTLVLKVAHEELGGRALGVTAVSPTYPQSELEDAKRIAQEIGARHEIVKTDQLAIPEFVQNDPNRCFHCKADLYQLLDELRGPRQSQWVVDGTHIDDLSDDRPGIAAARRWNVRSPLVESELRKSDIRLLARSLGLRVWDKPAAACLSSRIPRGTPITLDRLRRVERAEAVLHELGFHQVRVRDHGEIARIEVSHEDFERLNLARTRAYLNTRLSAIGFRYVCADLRGYRSGGVSPG